MPTLDEAYAPRPWACGECKRILGVVMREGRVRRLYVFFQARTAETMPTRDELYARPRGMFIAHGTDWCEGVECPICGARSEWSLGSELRARLRGELIREPV